MRALTLHEQAAIRNASNFSSIDYMQRHVPALFASFPHPKMSNRYGFTDTYELLRHLIGRGFVLDSVQQVGKGKFGKLMMRLSHPRFVRHGDGAVQLVVIDSHDGTSSFTIYLGWIRFACANGLILGDGLFQRKVKHTQPDLVAQVILDMQEGLEAASQVSGVVSRMRSVELGTNKILDFALDVAKQRFDFADHFDAENRYLRAASALTTRRRIEDRSNDVYTVLNVIQENALRGGITYTHNGVHKIKPISGIDAQVRINRAAWERAEKFLELEAA